MRLFFAFAALSVFLLSPLPVLAADDDAAVATEQSQVDEAEASSTDEATSPEEARSQDDKSISDDTGTAENGDDGAIRTNAPKISPTGGKAIAGLASCLVGSLLCPWVPAYGFWLFCPILPAGFAAVAGSGVLAADFFSGRKTSKHSLMWPMLAGAGVGTILFLTNAAIVVFFAQQVFSDSAKNYKLVVPIGVITVIGAVVTGLTTALLYNPEDENTSAGEMDESPEQQVQQKGEKVGTIKSVVKSGPEIAGSGEAQAIPTRDTSFHY